MIVVRPTGYFAGDNVHLFHAQSPQLAGWIANFLADSKDVPLYDFGCGTGYYLQHLRKQGFTSLRGFEGDPPKVAHFAGIERADLTKPMPALAPGNCLFLEVAEHIPPKFESAVLGKVKAACCDKLIMSWAVRGQPGDGHVNCVNNDEAVAKMEALDFEFLPDATALARSVIGSECPWFATTLLVMRKR